MLLVLLGTFALPTQGMLALLWACGAGVPTVVAARTLQSAALVGRLVGSATEAGAAAADGASLVILADVRPPPPRAREAGVGVGRSRSAGCREGCAGLCMRGRRSLLAACARPGQAPGAVAARLMPF
jgi:hypothetical protein